jgi:prepilin-type N-terminal cleavage/methylation domain-containing protein
MTRRAPLAVLGAASAAASGARAPRRAGGFTLLEVMIAMALLLIGGVSVLAVFTLAVTHRIERDVEARLDLVRLEALSMAQQAVDSAKPNETPAAIVNQQSPSQPAFSVSTRFVRSPNRDDPAWVALAKISYRGTPIPRGELKPMFLYRTVYERKR